MPLAVASAAASAASAEEESQELRTDSKSPYAHRINLYDHDERVIGPGDVPAEPYSPLVTCGKCHAVAEVQKGWHFNAGRSGIEHGRVGEPWILADPALGMQIPISARPWPGTYRPEQVGLSNWQFIKLFGRHLPGGGMADPGQESLEAFDEALRWPISGTLEIDCLTCHDGGTDHDPAECARQIERENFKYAATAAAGLAVVRGDAAKVPDDWDPFAPPDPDFPERRAPQVVYDTSRFDPDHRVRVDLVRRPPPERCYFCHTVKEVGPDAPQSWEREEDVHLAAGMVCTDCHSNGIDHRITRGYREEAEERGDSTVRTYSCEGCHLGDDDAGTARGDLGGAYGAPHPLHRGLPTIHFEKLTCTACHSGPWPGEYARRVQTSMAHGLGLPSKERQDTDLPEIVEPIFAAGADGRIAPHRMLWPALWGRLDDAGISPLPIGEVRRAAASVLDSPDEQPAPTDALPDDLIRRMLSELATQSSGKGEPVYVREGYVLRLEAEGESGKSEESSPASVVNLRLERIEHPQARPYLWPLAHEVRPARQSLGVLDCSDCHARGAPIFFGKLTVPGHADRSYPLAVMHELEAVDPDLVHTWSYSFRLRSIAKWSGIGAITLVGAILLLYGFGGLARILQSFR
jgi:hypothetical protein